MLTRQVKPIVAIYTIGVSLGLVLLVLVMAYRNGQPVDYVWVLGGTVVGLSCIAFAANQQKKYISVPTRGWRSFLAFSNVIAAAIGFALLYGKLAEDQQIRGRELPMFALAAAGVPMFLRWSKESAAPSAEVAAVRG